MIVIVMASIVYVMLLSAVTWTYLRASTTEAVTVEVGHTPGQRAAQHLQLLPADHMTYQVLLEGRGMMGLAAL